MWNTWTYHVTQQFHSQEAWKHVHPNTRTQMFAAALFTIHNRRNNPNVLNWWINKMRYMHKNGIPFGHKKESSTATHCNMGESQKHYAERKPVTKHRIPFSQGVQNRYTYRDRKQISGSLGLGVGRNDEWQSVFWGRMKCPKIRIWWWLHNSMLKKLNCTL